MISMSEYSILIEDNSKIFLVKKISFDKKKLVENFQAFMSELKKSKPTGAKGVFIKKISMSSTMGKSMIIDNSM